MQHTRYSEFYTLKPTPTRTLHEEHVKIKQVSGSHERQISEGTAVQYPLGVHENWGGGGLDQGGGLNIS